MPFFGGDSGSHAYILKRAIPAVVVKNVRGRAEFARRAIHGILDAATGLACFRSPVQVAGYKQIQLSIVVIVKESCRYRPSARGHSGLRRNIGESAVTVVVVKDVLSKVGHVNVRKPVVVVVPNSNSHSVVSFPGVLQAGLLSDVSERSVFILAVKAVPVFRVVPLEVNRAA